MPIWSSTETVGHGPMEPHRCLACVRPTRAANQLNGPEYAKQISDRHFQLSLFAASSHPDEHILKTSNNQLELSTLRYMPSKSVDSARPETRLLTGPWFDQLQSIEKPSAATRGVGRGPGVTHRTHQPPPIPKLHR